MTNLITTAGMAKLQAEYDMLRYTTRPAIVAEMHEAAKDGDFSENAPYQYARRRMREIDSRLRHLGNRLKVLKVGHALANPKHVAFGGWVKYEDDDGKEYCWQIIGPDEFDVSQGKISIDSPVAKALLGKRVDDELVLPRPAGNLNVVITYIGAVKP